MLRTTPTIELQGHRGARSVLPENTLSGFHEALAVGADCVELDVAMTLDGAIVVAHDSSLNPDITRLNGEWLRERLAIHTLPFAEVKTYDVGRINPDTEYARRFDRQRPIDGTPMPLLTEVFALAENVPGERILFDIEIKTDPNAPDAAPQPNVFAEALVQCIQQSRMQTRCRVRSFDWRNLEHVRRLAPDLPLAFLTVQQPWFDTVSARSNEGTSWLGSAELATFDGSLPGVIKHFGGSVWAPHYLDVSFDDVSCAHECGLKVIVWTVNDPVEIRRMIALGVDGITTDDPELARSLIDEAALFTRPRPVSG